MQSLQQLQLISPAEVAEIVGVDVSTLRAWRNSKLESRGPQAIKHGGRIKYDRAEVERWMREGDDV